MLYSDHHLVGLGSEQSEGDQSELVQSSGTYTDVDHQPS